MTETEPPADRDAPELRAFLADRDVECPGCGYNLRGLRGDVCPECRDRLELRVGMAEPKLGALLVTLSGLLAGAGTGVLFFVMLGYGYARYGRSSGPTWREIGGVVIVVITGTAVLTTLACLLARREGRAWFRRRQPMTRVWVAVSGWLLPIGFFLLAVMVGA